MNRLIPTLPLKSSAVVASAIALAVSGCTLNSDDTSAPASDSNSYRVYYQHGQVDYSLASLYLWNDNNCGALEMPSADANDWAVGLKPTGVDSQFGAYWDLQATDHPSRCINFIPRINGEKTLGEFDAKLSFDQVGKGNAVYTRQGIAYVYPELIALSSSEPTARVYLQTQDGDQADFTLHLWNTEQCDQLNRTNTSWPGIEPSGFSETYGVYWDVPVKSEQGCFNFIPNNKSVGDYQTADLQFKLDKTGAAGAIAMVFKGTDKVYYQPMTQAPAATAELKGASAIFIDDGVIALPAQDANAVSLYYSSQGEMDFDADKQAVVGSEQVFDSTSVSRTVWQISAPHLKQDFVGFDFDLDKDTLKTLAKGQLFAVAEDDHGTLLVTEVQTAKLLDSLYAREAKKLEYGAIIGENGTDVRLWAPTAHNVVLKHYDASKQLIASIQMQLDPTSGAWSAVDTQLKHGDYYRYEMTLYHPASKRVETYEVTDPYSLSLSVNSQYSQVVDLNHRDLKPAGWDELNAPHSQANAANFVLYEAHIRDFSALDASTEASKRGKYQAFTQSDAAPVQHLNKLSAHGVTHLHLLPAFDIATIDENVDNRVDLDASFASLCQQAPDIRKDEHFAALCDGDLTVSEALAQLSEQDSAEQPVVQRLHNYLRALDSFNWGYDPYHYTVPEGSYASDAEGMVRIKEFREMVMAIKNDIGMNVVMDVVYNHTNAQGLEQKSVLDKVVPWYYHRLNEFSGAVEKSTCCANTAPEHQMFAKLIDDSIQTWVRDYKIDAFRWDLMGHHPLSQMKRTLKAAHQVNPEVYFYGEGWNFGEVENDKRFKQATQPNLAGTGIGSFSDRLRDAVRGGSPFDEQEGIRRTQGFGNGLYVQPNDLSSQSEETKQQAMHLTDLVRLGMAGNLKDFEFMDSQDRMIIGSQLDYNGAPAGYARDAWEIQNYVSKHDNQTLWDNQQYKTAYEVTADERVRMQAVSMATLMLGQGVPFIHMGSELLRSKSMERDSYDSGDWYNRVDFTKQTNNWNVGLPREDKDGKNWGLIEQVIKQAGDNAKPTPAQIEAMDRYFEELLSLRSSSKLFRLGLGEQIKQRVSFHNTGSEQIPGLIVMSIENDGALYDASIDAARKELLVVINASPKAVKSFDRFNAAGFSLMSPQNQRSLAFNGDSEAVTVAAVNGSAIAMPAWSVAVFERTE